MHVGQRCGNVDPREKASWLIFQQQIKNNNNNINYHQVWQEVNFLTLFKLHGLD